MPNPPALTSHTSALSPKNGETSESTPTSKIALEGVRNLGWIFASHAGSMPLSAMA
jgi:hypothetical protein